jgi:hypothetical protein
MDIQVVLVVQSEQVKVAVMNVCLPLELLKHFSPLCVYVCWCVRGISDHMLIPRYYHTCTQTRIRFYPVEGALLPSSVDLPLSPSKAQP